MVRPCSGAARGAEDEEYAMSPKLKPLLIVAEQELASRV